WPGQGWAWRSRNRPAVVPRATHFVEKCAWIIYPRGMCHPRLTPPRRSDGSPRIRTNIPKCNTFRMFRAKRFPLSYGGPRATKPWPHTPPRTEETRNESTAWLHTRDIAGAARRPGRLQPGRARGRRHARTHAGARARAERGDAKRQD